MKVDLTHTEIMYLYYLIENNLETSIIVNFDHFWAQNRGRDCRNTQCHFEIDEIKRLRKNLNKKLVFKKLKYGTLKPRLAELKRRVEVLS